MLAESPVHADIPALLRQTHALLEGHFVLSSGLHSAQYVQCARLLEHPRHAGTVGAAIAALVASQGVEVVVGPALGGILVAHEVARALDVRCLFAERVIRDPVAQQSDCAEGLVSAGRPLQLRRGFEIRPGERVLVVEDVITTGGSARETAALIEQLGGVVVGYGAIVDRSGGTDATMPGSDLPLRALHRLTIDTFEPQACPLCAAGTAAVKPGSRA